MHVSRQNPTKLSGKLTPSSGRAGGKHTPTPSGVLSQRSADERTTRHAHLSERHVETYDPRQPVRREYGRQNGQEAVHQPGGAQAGDGAPHDEHGWRLRRAAERGAQLQGGEEDEEGPLGDKKQNTSAIDKWQA